MKLPPAGLFNSLHTSLGLRRNNPQNSHQTSLRDQSLCNVCNSMFTGPLELNKYHPHHSTPHAYLPAAEGGCYICRAITISPEWEKVQNSLSNSETVECFFTVYDEEFGNPNSSVVPSVVIKLNCKPKQEPSGKNGDQTIYWNFQLFRSPDDKPRGTA